MSDHAAGIRAGLPVETVFDTAGRISHPGRWMGMHRFDARDDILAELKVRAKCHRCQLSHFTLK
jgi:valyl-tRNA synthetase